MNNINQSFDFHCLISKRKKDVEIIDKIRVPVFSTKPFRKQHKIKKLLFFILREGFFRTYKKIRSSVIYSKSDNLQYFVIVKCKNDNFYYAGYQISINQPIFYFLPENSFKQKPSTEQVDKYFNHNPFIGYKLNDLDYKVNNSFESITLVDTIKSSSSKKSLYIIGGGRYVLTEILPIFKDYNFKGICEFNFELLRNKIFSKFELKTNDFDVLIDHAKKDTSEKLFIISSYHSYHTNQAMKAAKIDNSKIIIEKPPCITFEDYRNLLNIYDTNKIYIAYHRRFAPWNVKVKKLLQNYTSPLIVNMIIHEVMIPENHWYFAPNQGTRIAGNLCHWIDLAYFWINQKPTKFSITKNTKLGVDYSIYNILFENGTIVNLIPSDYGKSLRGVQEHITILGDELKIIISDYLKLNIWKDNKQSLHSQRIRDKGHVKLNKFYTRYVINKTPSPYSKKDFQLTTFTYLKFIEMWKCNIDNYSFREEQNQTSNSFKNYPPDFVSVDSKLHNL